MEKKLFVVSCVAIFMLLIFGATINAEQVEIPKTNENMVSDAPSISGFVKKIGGKISHAEVTIKGIGMMSGVEFSTISSMQGYYCFNYLPEPANYDQVYQITATKTVDGRELKGTITVLITINNFIKTDQNIFIKPSRSKEIANPLIELLFKNSFLNQRLFSFLTL